MPQINYTKTGGQIIYDYRDWLAGIDFAGGVINSGIINNKLNRANLIDPFRYAGYISPGKKPLDATDVSVATASLRNSIVYSQTAYAVSNNSLLHKITSLFSTPTFINAGNWPHTIDHAHTNEVGDDCTLYYDATPDLCFFYSFNDDTDWDVGIYNFRTDTFNDDFMSTVPTSPLSGGYLTGGKGYPHPLIVADDDVLYIGDRNYVHAYDWNTNTFSAAVLTLPKGYIITSLAKTNDRRLAIAAYYNIASNGTQPELYEGKSFVWVWNLLDLDPDFAYNLHDNYVSEIMNWNGQIIAFTAGFGTLGANAPYKLQILQNGEFEVLTSWTNGFPIRGGADLNQNEVYWNANGTVNSFAKNPYTGEYIYNYLSQGAGTASGMLRVLASSTVPNFFVSSGATTSGGLQVFRDEFISGSIADPKISYPACPPRQRCQLKKITINYKSLVTDGVSFRVNTKLDNTDERVSFNDITAVSNLKQIVLDNDANGVPLGNFTCIQPRLIWGGTGGSPTDCPVVENLIYDFEYINI
jgi:hypothetical protein